MLRILHSFDFLKQIEAYNYILLLYLFQNGLVDLLTPYGLHFLIKKCCHSRFQNFKLMHFCNLNCNSFSLLMVIYWDWYLAFIDVLLFQALSFHHSTFGDKILLAFKTYMSSLLKPFNQYSESSISFSNIQKASDLLVQTKVDVFIKSV